MNLFGPMIKRLKAPSLVCVWGTVSVWTRFTARKSLRRLQDILSWKKQNKTLFNSLLVEQGFDMSLSTNTVAFYVALSSTKVLSCTLLPSCVPASVGKVTFIIVHGSVHGSEINYSPVHLQTQMFCWHCLEFKGERIMNTSIGFLFVETCACFKGKRKVNWKIFHCTCSLKPTLVWFTCSLALSCIAAMNQLFRTLKCTFLLHENVDFECCALLLTQH